MNYLHLIGWTLLYIPSIVCAWWVMESDDSALIATSRFFSTILLLGLFIGNAIYLLGL